MDNLQITPILGKIEFDFSSARTYLAEKMSVYEGLIVEEDNIPQSKRDLAEIRKLRSSLEEQRKSVKTAFLEPYESFEQEYKKLIEIIDKSITSIDKQLKDFEVKRVEEKKKRIEELYKSSIGDFAEYLPLEKIYNPKWETKSASDQDIAFDISEKKTRVMSDLAAIEALKSEIYDELIRVYKSNGNDLSKAIQRNSQFIEDRERTRQRLEEEAKRKAEEEARKAEEEARKKAETKVESEENKAETKDNKLQSLNDFVQKAKTVKIIISVDDLKPVKETLDFMDINYSVEE